MDILIVGIGGQGTILASNVLCDVLMKKGYDVKKSEIHGMSQRGGSVISHIRYSEDRVFSPMVPLKQADLVLSFHPNETKRYGHYLKDDAKVIQLSDEIRDSLPNPRSLNMYGIGIMSNLLDIDADSWKESIQKFLKPKLHEANLEAFEMGRKA
jgi:indolepyruvate ferredoxin oxidoreductase beta subunit